MPALANLWQLHLLGVVIWVMCSTAVVFGVRYATRMVLLWLFVGCCAMPLAYLLATAYLGGSDTAAAVLAAGLGAVAAFLSGRATVLRWRVITAVSCVAFAIAAILALRQTNLLLTVIIAAGVIPAVHAVMLHHFSLATNRQRFPHVTVGFTRRSPASFALLAALAVAVLVTNLPITRSMDPPVIRSDWIQRSDLGRPVDFPFISRFFGPGSTLTRFAVAPTAGLPAAAVDVITTRNRGALRDFSDAVWYPTDMPVKDFTASTVRSPLPVHARSLHSDGDSTTSAGARNWYAVTWVWQSAGAFQQVTVVVNQSRADQRPPPDPRPLSLQSTLIQPALWIGRQQPDASGGVDDVVVRRAGDIAYRLLSAGESGE